MMIKPIVYDSQYSHVLIHAALREKRKGKALVEIKGSDGCQAKVPHRMWVEKLLHLYIIYIYYLYYSNTFLLCTVIRSR